MEWLVIAAVLVFIFTGGYYLGVLIEKLMERGDDDDV